MSRDIRTCIAILCYVLSVVNVSGLISNHQAIQDFLTEYNRQAEILYYPYYEATWTLYTNNSECTENLLALKKRKLNLFIQEMSRNASQYDLSSMSPSDRRKFIKIIDIGTDAQTNETKVERLSEIISDMETIRSTNPFPPNSPNSELLDMMLNTRRTNDLMEAVWLTTIDVYRRNMTDLYAEYVNLSNEAVGLLGYADTGDYWRSSYDSPTFEDEVRRLYEQLSPLWEQLHALIRRSLVNHYGRDKFPSSGHIPAHLFENLQFPGFRQMFNPFRGKSSFDVTNEMLRQNYTARRIFETADDFFKSMGMKAVPLEFWNKSLLEIIPGAPETHCNAKAYDFSNGRDYRIKMCTSINIQDLDTAHHEMGHIQYAMQYAHLPKIFRDGANPAFHEAIGEVISLSVLTEEHLYKIGLLDTVYNDNESDINLLMSAAILKMIDLPVYYIMDQWRWKVFRGEITPDKYNEEWWNLICRYQGISQPVQGSSDIFYPGYHYYIASNVPSIGYFVADVLKYQVHKALCNASGYHGPLHRCDIYNSTEAGQKFSDVLKLGASKPWPEVLQQLTGQSEMDAGPYLEFFQPLMDYLKTVNQDDYGWEPVCSPPPPKLCKAAIPGDCTCKKHSECESRGCCKRGICKWN